MKTELAIELYDVSIQTPSDSFIRRTYITGPLTYSYDYKVHHNYNIDDDFSTAFQDLIWLCNLRLMSIDYIPGYAEDVYQLEKIYYDSNSNHKFNFT